MNKKSYIELFAGCGGMALGLKKAGFDLYFANELSPMAGETFAYNILQENLQDLALKNKKAEKVIWLRSNYPDTELNDRLRENPFTFLNGKYSDISNNINFEEKLVIGDIGDLLNILKNNKELISEFHKKNIDLIAGGPPCQGFSLAGKRLKNDYKNKLPLAYAQLANLIKPKVVLLENVKGITAPFKTKDGKKHFAWFEVAKAFALYDFIPICMLINSKSFGIPQSRPRFIMIAFRKDIFKKISNNQYSSNKVQDILFNSLSFYRKIKVTKNKLDELKKSDLNIYNLDSDKSYFNGELLPKFNENEIINVSSAIDDISATNLTYKLDDIENGYARFLNNLFTHNKNAFEELANHEHRNHSYKVRARFRFYQIIENFNGLKQDALDILKNEKIDNNKLHRVFEKFSNEELLFQQEGKLTLKKIEDIDTFKEYFQRIASKKHTQRALKKDEPAPAQMTIPDDLCHYSPNELRTLTVREMARIQSFPDWFVFRSKVTTGGQQRSYEVPQYTQVGNAVPPLLAYELGKIIFKLLESID